MSRDVELERDALHFGKEIRSQWHASQHAVFTFSSWQSQVALRKSGRQQLWNMFLLTCQGHLHLLWKVGLMREWKALQDPPRAMVKARLIMLMARPIYTISMENRLDGELVNPFFLSVHVDL